KGSKDPALRDAFLPRRLEHHLEYMHHVRIVHTLSHLRQQHMVPHVVEEGAQVDVEDARLVLDNRLSHPVHRIMGAALRSIAIGPRLEVRLKDRLQDELDRPLDHAVADGRDREHATFCAPLLGNLLPSLPHGALRTCDQCILYELEEGIHAAGLDGLEGHPVTARGAIVCLGQFIGRAQRFHLADVDVQAPESPGWFSLRLGVYPPSQVLQTAGCRCHGTPASHVVRGLSNSRAPLLHGRYPASLLLPAPPSPSRLRPTSQGRWLYGLPSFRRFRGGTRRASPVARRVLVPMLSLPPRRSERAVSVSVRPPMQPSPFRLRARPPDLLTFEATDAFACATAWGLASIP